MALLQLNYFSQALYRTVSVNVILPADKLVGDEYLRPAAPYPTLYLLHGYCGNHTDWVNGTRVQRWAEERGLAVVMPSGENSFYVDQPAGKFGDFVGRELVELTRRMFPLSRRREDTFLAGLSMGGFGALRNGLKYYETFGSIAGFSSALDYFELPPDSPELLEKYNSDRFGALLPARETDVNPRVAFARMREGCQKNPALAPTRIYMACGSEDFLLNSNHSFRDYLLEAGADLTYVETPGCHSWDFWDTQIHALLDWLPLGAAQQGIHSGNVK